MIVRIVKAIKLRRYQERKAVGKPNNVQDKRRFLLARFVTFIKDVVISKKVYKIETIYITNIFFVFTKMSFGSLVCVLSFWK